MRAAGWEGRAPTQNSKSADSRHRGPPRPLHSRWRIPSRSPLNPTSSTRPAGCNATTTHPSPRIRRFTDTTIMHADAALGSTGLRVGPHVPWHDPNGTQEA